MPSLWDILLTLVGFLPQVFLLYFVLSCITDSGLLRSKTLLSVLLGFGCTTLAVCSLNAIADERKRKRMAVLLSFIPCSAMLPLLMLLLSAALHVSFWWVLAVYAFSIAVGLLLSNFLSTERKLPKKGLGVAFPQTPKRFSAAATARLAEISVLGGDERERFEVSATTPCSLPREAGVLCVSCRTSIQGDSRVSGTEGEQKGSPRLLDTSPQNTPTGPAKPARHLHFPNMWTAFKRSLGQTLLFSKKIFIAFTVSAFVITILARFTFDFHYTAQAENSILFYLCGVLSPIFAPIGLNNPAIICALLFGIIAKESAVSVLLLFPQIVAGMSVATAVPLIIFYSLYPVCLSCCMAVAAHCGKRTMPQLFAAQLAAAYIFSFIARIICVTI